jgi:hypothetical protein
MSSLVVLCLSSYLNVLSKYVVEVVLFVLKYGFDVQGPNEKGYGVHDAKGLWTLNPRCLGQMVSLPPMTVSMTQKDLWTLNPRLGQMVSLPPNSYIFKSVGFYIPEHYP